MNLTGAQRAAVIFAQLDEARAMNLLRLLTENEVIRLMAEVARLPAVTPDNVRQVMSEFADEAGAYLHVRQGGLPVAERWLKDRLGPGRASEIINELKVVVVSDPLAFLNVTEAGQIAAFLADEHPQTIALVLANIGREHAAKVLDRLGEEAAADVVRRMARLQPVPLETVQEVAMTLQHRLADISRGAMNVTGGGIPAAAAILNHVEGGAELDILQFIEDTDSQLAESIRNEMFVFDDIVQLEDSAVQIVLRSVVTRDLALALKTAAPELAEKLKRNMTERQVADLDEEAGSLGAQRLSKIEAAQGAVLKAVRDLIDRGDITVRSVGDELIA